VPRPKRSPRRRSCSTGWPPGHWNDQALQPSVLNANAAALGPSHNVYSSGGSLVATPPAFVSYRPHPHLRPFDLGGLWTGVR
jgi:hypothetical protein